MANSILASALLPGGDDPAFSAVVAAPVANVWYNLDLVWGAGSLDAPAVVATTLSCAGAAIDTGYGPAVRGHGVPYTGRRGVDLGWSPNGKPVYLTALDAALGLWRIQFPVAGSYTVTLSGFGTLFFTVASGPPAATAPVLSILHTSPLNRQPSKLLKLTFSGIYPPGGLDLSPDRIGLRGVLFADLNDDATYRYTWSGDKLRAWTGNGEVSGTVNLSTIGLFFGMVG
jgi:hypothetical protein